MRTHLQTCTFELAAHCGPEPFFSSKFKVFLIYFCLIYSNMKGTFCFFDLDANLK
jgi:hypothetical protein